MQISNAKELKAAIQELENRKLVHKDLLVEHFHETYEHFKPINLLKSTIAGIDFSPASVGDTLMNAGLSAGAGLLSKKLFVGGSGNIFKRTLGLAVELGVANLVSKHSDGIKEKGLHFIKNLLNRIKKEKDSL